MPRFLVIGDIHGNLPALEAVLSKERDWDQIVCHGDVVNYGPWSNECVDLLEFQKAFCLTGNHEIAFLNGAYTGPNDLVQLFTEKCLENFKRRTKIEKYSPRLIIGTYQIQHTIAGQYIFGDTPLDFMEGNYIIGHSHQQFLRHIGGFVLANTGSVGQNRTIINRSEYLIYDSDLSTVTLKNCMHNIDLVIGEMKRQRFPEKCVQYYMSKSKE